MNTSVIEYKADNVIILLMWTPENGVVYNVSAKATEPEAATINLITASSANLIVSYNVHINVSIVATGCGQSSTVTNELHYGELLLKIYYSLQ